MTPDRHFTDEEIALASGASPRMPAGVPRATCLECGAEHVAAYAAQAHDCLIDLAEKRTYAEWLEQFRIWGYGVLESVNACKFRFDKVITGRTMLTFHLQSDLDRDFAGRVIDRDYYRDDQWVMNGFWTDGIRSA